MSQQTHLGALLSAAPDTIKRWESTCVKCQMPCSYFIRNLARRSGLVPLATLSVGQNLTDGPQCCASSILVSFGVCALTLRVRLELP